MPFEIVDDHREIGGRYDFDDVTQNGCDDLVAEVAVAARLAAEREKGSRSVEAHARSLFVGRTPTAQSDPSSDIAVSDPTEEHGDGGAEFAADFVDDDDGRQLARGPAGQRTFSDVEIFEPTECLGQRDRVIEGLVDDFTRASRSSFQLWPSL